MKQLNVIGVYLFVVLLFGVMSPLFTGMALATEKSKEQNADRKALKTGLEDTLGMPVLKGDVWQQMTHDSKIAFVWGFGHVVSIEQHLMKRTTSDEIITKYEGEMK